MENMTCAIYCTRVSTYIFSLPGYNAYILNNIAKYMHYIVFIVYLINEPLDLEYLLLFIVILLRSQANSQYHQLALKKMDYTKCSMHV